MGLQRSLNPVFQKRMLRSSRNNWKQQEQKSRLSNLIDDRGDKIRPKLFVFQDVLKRFLYHGQILYRAQTFSQIFRSN